jgi:hypothetical protein
MNSKKIKVNWQFKIESNNGSWINSENPDFSIDIDTLSGGDYLALYEPISIMPHIYRRISNIKNSYKKIFTYNESFCDGDKVIKIPPFIPSWIDRNSESLIYSKTKIVSMIASNKSMCEGHFYRNRIANEFPYKNDLYGRGRNNIEKKVDGLKDYMFSVSMENCVCDTYYTEKILDCFLTGTVPIYYGTRKVNEIFDPGGIIFLEDMNYNDLNCDLYESMLPSIKNNFNIAMSMKFHSSDMIDYIVDNI